MTQEENRELLLEDFFGRLPHGVTVINEGGDYIKVNFHATNLKYLIDRIESGIDKMVLRSFSSMTEEEFEKLKKYSWLEYSQLDLAEYQNGTHKCLDFYLSEVPSYVVVRVFDWLNINNFDYRNLIIKGLAVEAPEGMYNN